jgi:WD40 repeat protein
VFNKAWISTQLDRLRPYAQPLNAWIESGFRDESRLLRGQALHAAVEWAQDKSLSDVDYQFLAASQGLDRRIMQQQLEAERLQEVEARLALERQSSRNQRRLLLGMGIALGVAVMSSVAALNAYQQSVMSEVRAIAAASKGNYDSNQRFDALLLALQARDRFQSLWLLPPGLRADLNQLTYQALEQATQGADETNRLLIGKGGVLAVDHSPNGRWIATAGTDRAIRLWKPDGTLVHTLPTNSAIHGVRFSPDGQRLVAAAVDGMVHMWDVATATRLLRLEGHTAPVWNADFSPDGQILASASSDRTIRLWKLDGTLLHTLEGHTAAAWQVAFHPSGRELVSASMDGTLRFWTIDGTLLRTVRVGNAAAWSVDYSPDGQTLASSGADNRVRLWSAEGELLKTLEGHTAEVLQVRFSSDGKMLASVSGDRTVRLWRKDGMPLRTFRGHQSVIRSVSISPDSATIASASEDGQVKLWKQTPFYVPLPELGDLVWRVSHTGEAAEQPMLATLAGSQVQLWQPDGTLLKTLTFPGQRLISGAFDATGKTLALGSADSNLYLVDLESGAIARLQGHTAMVLAVQYTPDGRFIASVADDGTLRLWKRQTDGSFQLHQSLSAHSSRIWDLAISPDGRQIATASVDSTVKVWGWNTPDQLLTTPQQVLKGHQAAVWGVDFSPDSQQIASAGRDRQLMLWSRDGQMLWARDTGGLGLSQAAFSPDGKRIAVSGQDNTIQLWSREGTLLRTLRAHESSVRTVDFSADSKLLVSGGEDQAAMIWNLDKLLDLDLIGYGCNWLRDYLQAQPELTARERHLCQKFF